MRNGRTRQVATATAASIHHIAQMKVIDPWPQCAHSNTHMLMSVAKPIGNVPVKRLWVGCRNMRPHSFG